MTAGEAVASIYRRPGDPAALRVMPPRRPLTGAVSPPGSKSITNRALLIAALARGTSRLTGALRSADTIFMAQALRAMGVRVEEPGETELSVTGCAGRLAAPAAPLFLGNAGTAVRFLTAAAVLAQGDVTIDGDAHMQKRPVQPLIDALRRLGVEVAAPTGAPPVTLKATGGFAAGEMTIDASLSSQYASALLMLAPFGQGPVRVALAGEGKIGARGYIDLTLAAMRRFGAKADQIDEASWAIEPTGYEGCDFQIEPDASAATYLWAAQALTGGSIDIGTPAGVFTQPDARACAIIEAFPRLPPVIDGSQMQDAVPTLAVVAAFSDAPTRFVGIANLRVKECDRVAAMATELSRLAPGLAREDGDDLLIEPRPASAFRAARIETYSDHRIAMSMALAGLRVDGVTILDPGCVRKTYPDYWDDLRMLGVTLLASD